MKIEAGWTGLQGAIHGLDSMPKSTQRELGQAIRRSTNAVRREVRSSAPRKSRGPHQVSAGIRARVKGSGIETVGEVYLGGIAIPVARGPKPHQIMPKSRRALRFSDRFAAVIQHPGASPNQFFERGIVASLPVVDKELDAAGVQVLGDVIKSIDSDKG